MDKKGNNISSFNLFDRVVSILEQARSNVIYTVNNQTVTAYWLIGREIVQELQGGEVRAGYGKQLLENLSEKLTKHYGKGFSLQNLKLFRQFYRVFSNRNPISYPLGSQLNLPEKAQPINNHLHSQTSESSAESKFLKTFHPGLSWSHYRALMHVKKPEELRIELQRERRLIENKGET